MSRSGFTGGILALITLMRMRMRLQVFLVAIILGFVCPARIGDDSLSSHLDLGMYY
jgi:hypothetical protein